MNKVLIYLYKDSLHPVGGPLGYNYNLKSQLDVVGCNDIHFIELANKADTINKQVTQIKCSWLRSLLIIAKSIYKKTKMLYGLNHKAVINLQDYDIVHFHSTADMYNAKDDLKEYKGKVLLTSHSPTLNSKEMYTALSGFEKKYLAFLYKNLIKIDQYSFERADYIIFPCEEAEEPYFHNWKGYAQFSNESRKKIRYLLTGINMCIPKVLARDIRVKYNIPLSAFVVSYVGRHNEIKGYDDLKLIGSRLLNRYENIYILIAGKESPLKGLSHERWIEVGWANDPYSIINASDVFVLPNKETYFDLILLEVLSLGKIVIASKTGGNKFFERFELSGISLFENVSEAITKIEEMKNKERKERNLLENENKALFQQYFTASIFADNYIKLIKSL